MTLGETLADMPAEVRLASPCVGVCRLDADTGWCLGCGRSAQDLAIWRELDEPARERIWRELPHRRARLGLRFDLLPLTPPTLLERLARMTAEPGAVWAMGVYGAVAELMAKVGEVLHVETRDGTLTVRTAGGLLRLHAHPGLRAFALTDGQGRTSRIVLALHRSRLPTPAQGVTELGADAEAIDPAGAGDRLFDLGLGLAPVRFCVRTADHAALRALRNHAGRSPLLPSNLLLPVLLSVSPDRIVISPACRLEVRGAILNPGHEGPHTHLLPGLLAERRELEPGFELPAAYAPCASFYPPAGDVGLTHPA